MVKSRVHQLKSLDLNLKICQCLKPYWPACLNCWFRWSERDSYSTTPSKEGEEGREAKPSEDPESITWWPWLYQKHGGPWVQRGASISTQQTGILKRDSVSTQRHRQGITLFIQYIFIKYLLCARYCTRH